ncbi:MAG: HAD hydrolase-like protein [Candidatus Altiarchaeota archaeon]|nr:HAD hydrolase-like protein [Candidatus Altiarchaeota archaeon]
MKPDVIVWDIDGVLVDVRESYRKAIMETVQYYFTGLIGLDLEKKLMTFRDTQMFKLSGRFNDDWKVTYASVLCFLTKLVHELDDEMMTGDPGGDVSGMAAELRKLGTTRCLDLELDLKDITGKIKMHEGGLEGTKKALEEISEKDFKVAEKFWFQPLIKRVFQELYLGELLFREKYGEEPLFIKGEGFIGNEKPLINSVTLKRLRERCLMGVATGRERFEAEFVLNKHGFKRFIPLDLIVSSEDVTAGKPEPDQLLECKRRICEKYSLDEKETKTVYVGDSIDDVSASKKAGFYSIGCLSAVFRDEEKDRLRKEFQKLRCDLILEDANEVLKIVE